MKVILKEKIKNLGSVGDLANVKPGYARNYLIPFGKVVLATKVNILKFEKEKHQFEKEESERLLKAEENAEKISNHSFIIKAASGDGGKLFGSITSKDIIKVVLEQTGLKIEKRNLHIPNKTIRHLGEFVLSFSLHSNVNSKLTIVVQAR